MINAERENLIRLVTELSVAAPELRFGQMIANLSSMADSAVVDSIWDVEDDELAAAAQRLVNYYRQRETAVA